MKKFDGLLLGCDMDGTLLDSRKQISAKNQEAIWYFVKNGGSFSLATGRAPRAIDIYRTLLPFNAPYTHLNGSLIMDSSQNIMWCAGMPQKTVELMDAALSKFSQLGCEIFEGEKIHVRRMSAETEYHMRVLNLKYDMVSDCELPDTSGWCKINLTGPELIMADVRKFLSRYENEFCIAASTPNFWEITAANVNKGSSLLKIADMLGIKHKNVLAIGDSSNDDPMLQVAGVSFVPENAANSTKSLADVVVRDNNSHAVAAAIEWLDTNISE